jgi:hypothetical protein
MTQAGENVGVTSAGRGSPMWVFTKHGYFSAVCARQGGGKHGQPPPGQPHRSMVATARGIASRGPRQLRERGDHADPSASAFGMWP